MKNFITLSRTLCFATALSLAAISYAQDENRANSNLRDAEYYQRQAENYERDAEYYLRQSKSHSSDAQYYLRNKKYDRAIDYFRRAADDMDRYRDKLEYARNAADRSRDYFKRAADALRK